MVAAEREVVAPAAPAAERLEVPVALVERQAQLAEQQRAPPMREQRLVRRELERYRLTPRRQYNE